jgi:hypothetical protein
MLLEVLEDRAREESLELNYRPRSDYVALRSREGRNLLAVNTATGAFHLIAGKHATARREQNANRYAGVPMPSKPHVFVIPEASQRRAPEDSIADLNASGGSIHEPYPWEHPTPDGTPPTEKQRKTQTGVPQSALTETTGIHDQGAIPADAAGQHHAPP